MIFHIIMQAMIFSPSVIHIPVNSIIVWENRSDSAHNVVFKDFRSPYLIKGNIYRHKFITVGTYDYYCEPHRAMGMIGKVIVE